MRDFSRSFAFLILKMWRSAPRGIHPAAKLMDRLVIVATTTMDRNEYSLALNRRLKLIIFRP